MRMPWRRAASSAMPAPCTKGAVTSSPLTRDHAGAAGQHGGIGARLDLGGRPGMHAAGDPGQTDTRALGAPARQQG